MTISPAIKGIFFDLYGTLLLYNDIKAANETWVNAFYTFINRRSTISIEELKPVCREILTSSIEKDRVNGLTTYETKIKNCIQNLGIEMPLNDIKELADYSVITWQKHISTAERAEEVLSALKKNYILVLITNFDHSKHIHRVLDETKLHQYFDHVVISDEVEVDKPDIRIFNFALNKAGMKPEEVVFVGDSLNDDIRGALDAGIAPIFISQETYNVNHEFENGEEVNSYLHQNRNRITIINSLSELIVE